MDEFLLNNERCTTNYQIFGSVFYNNDEIAIFTFRHGLKSHWKPIIKSKFFD